MEKVEIRAVIKYLCKKGMSPKEIHEDFMDTLGKKSPSYRTVKNGLHEFKRGGKSIGHDERPGRPKKAFNDEAAEELCTILSCATEDETCEALRGKWV
jgi:transposase